MAVVKKMMGAWKQIMRNVSCARLLVRHNATVSTRSPQFGDQIFHFNSGPQMNQKHKCPDVELFLCEISGPDFKVRIWSSICPLLNIVLQGSLACQEAGVNGKKAKAHPGRKKGQQHTPVRNLWPCVFLVGMERGVRRLKFDNTTEK